MSVDAELHGLCLGRHTSMMENILAFGERKNTILAQPPTLQL
jgi:hypothetical protein